MGSERCASCRFARADVVPWPNARVPELRTCRRFPPSEAPPGGAAISQHVIVCVDDWCGEYRFDGSGAPIASTEDKG